MNKANENTEKRLTMGLQPRPSTYKRKILYGWIATLLSLIFVRTPFVGMISFYASLGFGVHLIRQKEKSAKINGWIITLFFAFRFIGMFLLAYGVWK